MLRLREIYREFCKKQKIDFIYERYAFYCRAGVKAAKDRRIPVVLEVNEISGIKRVRGQVLQNLAKKIEIRNFSDATLVVVVSKFLKEQIVGLGIPQAKIAVIPNGVNLAYFTPTKALGKGEKVVLGFVGGFVSWHNFPLMFDTFQDLVSKKATLELILVNGIQRPNGEMGKERSLTGKVISAGTFPHSQIPQIINPMDICLIPQYQ